MPDRSPVDEIGELNLTYMLLAQRLIRQDRATAMFRFGLNDEIAAALAAMPLSRIVHLSNSGQILCRLRLEDNSVLDMILKDSRPAGMQQAHLSILLGGKLGAEVQGHIATIENTVTKVEKCSKPESKTPAKSSVVPAKTPQA